MLHKAGDEITHRNGIYFIRCVMLSEIPEQWYWHLYRDDKRINGGLNESIEEAMWAGGMNYRRDNGDYASRRGSERV